MAAGLYFVVEKLLAGFGALRWIDEDGYGKQENGAHEVEITHSFNNIAHSFVLLIMNKEIDQKNVESSIPVSKFSYVTLPFVNIGTTIEPKNSKPIFDSVSAVILICVSDSIYHR